MSESKGNAFGAIETFGLVWVLEAGDAMCKAGDVNLIGYENTASGYISILVEGDVSAVEAAVHAGVEAVEALGAEVGCHPAPASRSEEDHRSLPS